LANQFKTLEGQAKDASLSFVNLLDWRTEYGQDAMERFRELCEGQTLVANIDHREPNQLYLSLFDPSDPTSLTSHESSINVQLVREGLARIDRKSRLRDAYPGVVKALEQASKEAKRGRYGAYELGDILEDD
jgi:staphylococcal nuclease domain-containing protein 1